MAKNYTATTPILGVNLEGNEQPPAQIGSETTTQFPVDGAPRVPPATVVLISGGKVAIYGVAKAALNPAATVAFENFVAATIAATTATADHAGIYLTLNIATCATGDYIWARGNTAVGS